MKTLLPACREIGARPEDGPVVTGFQHLWPEVCDTAVCVGDLCAQLLPLRAEQLDLHTSRRRSDGGIEDVGGDVAHRRIPSSRSAAISSNR